MQLAQSIIAVYFRYFQRVKLTLMQTFVTLMAYLDYCRNVTFDHCFIPFPENYVTSP